MSFNFDSEAPYGFSFDCEKLAEEIVTFALDHENFPYEAEVNLTLTDNEGIKIINKEYRNINEPTDVLSFPLIDYDAPGDFSNLENDYGDNFNPDTGEIMLGDIIISADKVREQAEEFGHSEKREFAFLIVHSILHLLGYDHIEKEDAKVMEPKQREILEAMNILRE